MEVGGLGFSSPPLELPFEAPTHACILHLARRLPDRVALCLSLCRARCQPSSGAAAEAGGRGSCSQGDLLLKALRPDEH